MRIEQETNPRVCAIVVTYQPSQTVIENVELLSKQFSEVIVVDNGSVESSAQIVSQLKSIQGVSVICNTTNLGIAAALNQGIRDALSLGYDWVATFDQDSCTTPGYTRNMFTSYAACQFRDIVGIISPMFFDNLSGWEKKQPNREHRKFSPVTVAMSSGSFIKAQVFERAGWYDESLFIDYVDFDFCLRLRDKGFRTIQSLPTGLLHELGTSERHSFFGFSINIKTHNAVRYYYIMRNRVIMYRRYGLRFPLWAGHDLTWLCLDLTKIILWESDKRVKLQNTFKGFRDAIFGRLGPLTAYS